MIWRILVVIAGIGVVAAATHVNVIHAGGYDSSDAPLIITLAILLSVGMGFVGYVWGEGQWLGAVVLGVCMLAGETYWVLTIAEREIARRAQQEAPTVQARKDREAAETRLAKAETALTAASSDVASEAAKPDCLKNCAAMLTASQVAAKAEVDVARTALGNVPRALSLVPLPERLGVAPWLWDLIMAGLRSLAVVGGSIAVGLATHPKKRMTKDLPATPLSKSTTATLAKPLSSRKRAAPKQVTYSSELNARNHAAEFGVKCLRADPAFETAIVKMHDRYRSWCEENSYPRLPAPDLARELGSLFSQAGLPVEDRGGGNLTVRGVRLV